MNNTNHGNNSTYIRSSGLLILAENSHDRRTALHLAAESGWEGIVRTLLDFCPSKPQLLGKTDSLGQTALHLAALSGHAETVCALLRAATDRSALLRIRERVTGQTALHFAAEAQKENKNNTQKSTNNNRKL